MTPDLSHIRGIIWDLDGTLYRFDDLFIKACNVAAARAAQSLGVNITYEQAVALAVKSEAEQGYSLHGFIHEYGLTYAQLHAPFHQHIDEKLIQRNDDFVKALESLCLPHVLLTNASRDWANRALSHLGMKHLFLDHHIIPMEDVNFTPKSRGKEGFEKALFCLSLSAKDVLIVEDLPRNLYIPHQMGMTTALVTHGGAMPLVDIPVDLIVDDVTQVAEHLQCARNIK
ncbi:MAG: HAD hydrolase-like protein [Alphaproteobacteria bacterium]|nr:HAD hydrolase-like protein [Alphaproteobacteria bacterium]